MQIDTGRLDRAIGDALYGLVEEIGEQADTLMTEERWYWPRKTYRANGEIAYSPRDIYDTGELFNSQRSYSDGNQGEIFYDCDYAADVHIDRPWLETAMHETNIEKVFAKRLKRGLF